jgi:hypothetical protein
MRVSFVLALAVNFCILFGFSVESPSRVGQFPSRDQFPHDAVVVGGLAPLSTQRVHDAILAMGYVQTALSTVGMANLLRCPTAGAFVCAVHTHTHPTVVWVKCCGG